MIRPLLHTAALTLLAACAPVPDPVAAPDHDAAPADTVVRKTEVPPLGTLLDSATIDVDGDGVAERVELGVNAGRDDQGKMVWDLHNEWTVVVRDGPDAYPLLRISFGGAAAFWVIPGDSTRPAQILVQISHLTSFSGGTQLEEFVFCRSRGGYVRTGSVGGFGAQVRYRGPPDYAEAGDLFPPTSWRGDLPEDSVGGRN